MLTPHLPQLCYVGNLWAGHFSSLKNASQFFKLIPQFIVQNCKFLVLVDYHFFVGKHTLGKLIEREKRGKVFPISFWLEIVWKIGKKVNMDFRNDCFSRQFSCIKVDENMFFSKGMFLPLPFLRQNSQWKVFYLCLLTIERIRTVNVICEPPLAQKPVWMYNL